MRKHELNKGILPRQIAETAKFIRTACAFTGPRPEKLPWRCNEDDPACVALKKMLAEQITKLADGGYIHFLSGMAQGIDQYCASAVLALRMLRPEIKLHCILPCVSQADKWTGKAQEAYHSILEQADTVLFVNRDERRTGMMERNRFLVDHCSVLLAVYRENGTRRSGTAATVQYARRMGRELIMIDPISLDVQCENMECQ